MPHSKMMTVADLAKKMKVTPRRARAMLRKAQVKSRHDYNWTFRPSEVPKIIAHLSSSSSRH